MKKRMLSFVLCFILLILLSFAPSSFASEKVLLNSTSNNEKEFKEIYVERIVDEEGEEGYEITIEDEVDEDGIEGYSIVVDVEEDTYETEQLSEEEILEELQEDAIETEFDPIDNEEEELLIQNLQINKGTTLRSGVKTAFLVSAFTRDPPNANLTRTTNKLVWKYNGKKAEKYSRQTGCIGFAPTMFGTNWYTSSCVRRDYSIINNGKHVTSRVIGQYYNWDFGNKKKKTNAAHNVYIRGGYNGKANYTATFSKSGEASSLLSFRVLTAKVGS